jgi:hypothetical protein
MQRPPRFYTPARTILPGTPAATIATVGGNFWYVMRASHPRFEVAVNDGEFEECGTATGDVYPEDFQIEKIAVKNLDPSLPLEIVFKTGKGRPLNDKLNVYENEVAPSIRDEVPSLVTEVTVTEGVGGYAVNTWKKVLEADEFRAYALLSTDSVTSAFYGYKNTDTESSIRNLVTSGGLSGVTEIRTKAEVWVKFKEAGKSITVIAHKFA